MAMLLLRARLCRFALLFLGLLALPRPVLGQATPADTAAILLDAASRLDREGRGDAAAALLDYIRSHYGTTPAAAEAVTRLAGRPPAESRIRRELRGPGGRTELMVWGTSYGIWAGIAVPAAARANGPSPYGLGLLLGAPAGLLAARAYANHVNISEGAARSITFGGTWGTWQGYGIAKLLGVLEHKQTICPPGLPGTTCYENKTTSGSAAIRAMLLGGLAGIGAGAILGQVNEVSPGTATFTNLAALWGTGYGAGFAALTGARGKAPLAMAVIGGDAALLGGAAIAPNLRISRERARLISIAGVVGALAGGGVDLLIQVDNERVGVLIPMVGGTLGLLTGAAVTSNMPREAMAPPAGGAAPGSAVLRVDDGRVGLGLPAPAPLARVDRLGHTATAVYVPLLSARF